MIKDLLIGNYRENADIKATEIAKLQFDLTSEFIKDDFRIEILNITKISGGAIQILAKAWKGQEQLGFGTDGSVEIERFKIFNPPILIDDLNGEIIREYTDPLTGEVTVRKLSENPIEAIRQSLSHTISLVGKTGTKIIKDKIGNTTSTFYPSSDDSIYATSTTYSTAHDASTGTLRGSATQNVTQATLLGSDYYVERAFVNWDTSSITDTDTINSATASFYGQAKTGTDGRSYNVYSSTASDPIVANDFDLVGGTAYSDTAITQAAWSTSAYNDYAFNATGIAAISVTGLTKVSHRDVTKDVGNTAPTDQRNVVFHPVEVAGTANDPKLVVVSTAAAASTNASFLLNLI